MSYQLLYSRQRNDDVSVRFTDVPVESPSIMVDALSFLSKFKRSAGWLYPIVPSAGGDYERGKGQLILFGKNRVNIQEYSPPYFLEFYPRYGVSKYILSVYTGTFEPEDSDNWFGFLNSDWQFRYNNLDGYVYARLGNDGSGVPISSGPVGQVFILRSVLYWRLLSGVYYQWNPVQGPVELIAEDEYLSLAQDPDAVSVS